ncbi:hypothetical protein [Metamycoplasma cloacale]|nr:hypothetical protein [Metamycoplasma cloacale]
MQKFSYENIDFQNNEINKKHSKMNRFFHFLEFKNFFEFHFF